MTGCASAHPGRPPQGVTLIEMMVVVALVGLLLALAAPSIRELLATQRLLGIHGELITDLQHARSEAVRRRRPLRLEFAGDGSLSCYVMYVDSFGVGDCDCTRPPGSACSGQFEELKTVHVPRSTQVSMAASSARAGPVWWDKDTGFLGSGEATIELASTVRGRLRVTVNALGRPSTCSPDGSVRKVERCP